MTCARPGLRLPFTEIAHGIVVRSRDAKETPRRRQETMWTVGRPLADAGNFCCGISDRARGEHVKIGEAIDVWRVTQAARTTRQSGLVVLSTVFWCEVPRNTLL